MSKKTLLERLLNIKQKFDDMLPTAYKLADGTEVTISLLDIGGDFMIAGAPAPEGVYTLSDGTGVTVDSTGKITAIAEPAEFSGTEYTLADGTKVSIDKMDVGGVVMQGEAKIANSEYKLMDGSKFTTVDGIITVVTPKPAEAAPGAMSKEAVQQAYDDIATAAPTDQVSKLTICVKALMEYAFGWQLDGTPEENAKAAEVAQSTADALNVYNQGLESQRQKFEAQDKLVLQLQADLKDTRDTLKQALELMTQLAESPAGDPPAPKEERKVLFSGEKRKEKGIDRFAKAAEALYNEKVNN